jgi:hypothetical protein
MKPSMKVSICPPTKEPHWKSSKMQLNYELTKNELIMNIKLNMNELWIDLKWINNEQKQLGVIQNVKTMM